MTAITGDGDPYQVILNDEAEDDPWRLQPGRCCQIAADGRLVVQSIQQGDVVQLVRTLPCHGRGRGFESRRPRHSLQSS